MKNLNCEVLELDIEEAIKNLKVLIGLEEFNKLSYKENKSIETLLTAYEKEKGKNVKLRLQDIPLIEGELKAYKDRVNELKQELEKEKKKNKKINKYIEDRAKIGKDIQTFINKDYVEQEYISKDKIKTIIEEVQKDLENSKDAIEANIILGKKLILQSLLDKEE